MTARDVIEGRAEWALEERDCLAVLAELPPGSIDAVITDPPYGMAYEPGFRSKESKWDTIIGDEKPQTDFIAPAVAALREGGCMACFCSWHHNHAFRVAMEAAGLVIRCQGVWDRMCFSTGDLKAAFSPSHDLIWFGTKGDGFAFHDLRPASVFRVERVMWQNALHPTQKPEKLMRSLVRPLSPRGGIVLDPFGGSGSTGVSALMEGRRAILCELEPKYAETARARMRSANEGYDAKRPRQAALPMFGGEA